MKVLASLAAGVAIVVASAALGQSNPDYRVKADFRTPDNGAWGANESVGNAEFRVQSRFLAVYYGGVARSDEFKFNVQIDFTLISGFATQFASSTYNSNYDLYINNAYVGRAIMGLVTPGIAELQYDSRHPSPPALPIPAGWPSPINPGSTVRVFFAAPVTPAIGDPFPAGTPVFISDLAERFARGDANTDGRVDNSDFAIFAPKFDPQHLTGAHIGPVNATSRATTLPTWPTTPCSSRTGRAAGTPPPCRSRALELPPGRRTIAPAAAERRASR